MNISQPKNWVQVPYNYFFLAFYAALGTAIAIHPVNQQTIEIAGPNARLLGYFIGTLFFVVAYLHWQNELRGKWLTTSMMPAVIWGAFSMVTILGNERAAWVIVVFIASSIALLVYCAELRLIVQSNETVTQEVLKENVALRLEVEALKRQNATNAQ